MITIHPSWVARSGIGDIVRFYQLRGFEVSNAVGSRFFHVEPKSHPLQADIEAIDRLIRGKRR